MRVIKLVSFIFFSFIVAFPLAGCKDFLDLDEYPNIVTVTFEANGGKWPGGGTGNEIRGGTEGVYFHLPAPPRYVLDATYNESKNETTVSQKEFLGWTLKGGSVLIYNQHDTKGAYPDEDKTYAAKWGDREIITESGDTRPNYQ